jgi:hypothetical protein
VADKRLEIACDAGVATLKRQGETLNSLRNRASAVLSVAALVISVGGGIGLIKADASHGALPRWAGFSLIGVVVVIGILVVTVQWPVRKWAYGLGPGPVFELLEEERDEDALRLKLILLMANAVKKNEGVLNKRSLCYQIATALLVAEVLIFMLAITIR